MNGKTLQETRALKKWAVLLCSIRRASLQSINTGCIQVAHIIKPAESCWKVIPSHLALTQQLSPSGSERIGFMSVMLISETRITVYALCLYYEGCHPDHAPKTISPFPRLALVALAAGQRCKAQMDLYYTPTRREQEMHGIN